MSAADAPGSPDGLEMLHLRLHTVDEGPQADAYSELLADIRSFLDSFARAHPDLDEIDELQRSVARMRAITDARRVPEIERPFGSGRTGPDSSRAQCMTPDILLRSATPTECRAEVTLGDYFLGVNGAAHGGVIPLIFDEALGRLASSPNGLPARTAYLNTTFRAITPIGAKLDIVARIDRVEGRKRFASGEIRAGERLCAQVEALFVELRPGQP